MLRYITYMPFYLIKMRLKMRAGPWYDKIRVFEINKSSYCKGSHFLEFE